MSDVVPVHPDAAAASPAPEPVDAGVWFDVPRLLAHSRPQTGRGVLLLPPLGLGALLGALLITAFNPGPAGIFLAIVLLGVSVGTTIYLARLAAAARAERQRVREAEELVTLRHWPQAAAVLRSLLDRPMRLNPSRRTALVALARTLGRYGLYDEAIEVADAILADRGTDPATRFAVGCGRAMLLLQSGRLSDANDAIGRLRSEVRQIDTAVKRAVREREEREANGEPGEAEPVATAEPLPEDLPAEAFLDEDSTPAPAGPPSGDAGFDSAALNLVELYRDVHTFHTIEALEAFDAKRTELRDGLGLRFGDALALAAVAAHHTERGDAAQLWADATCLVPAVELTRRYPEVRDVAERYPATPPPSTPHPNEKGAA